MNSKQWIAVLVASLILVMLDTTPIACVTYFLGGGLATAMFLLDDDFGLIPKKRQSE